jgi:hypothetical protein
VALSKVDGIYSPHFGGREIFAAVRGEDVGEAAHALKLLIIIVNKVSVIVNLAMKHHLTLHCPIARRHQM